LESHGEEHWFARTKEGGQDIIQKALRRKGEKVVFKQFKRDN